MSSHYQYPLPPLGQSNSSESRMPTANGGTAILMRKLPRNTSREELRSMLLFAKDLKEADFILNKSDEDRGFLTAVARFRTPAAAAEAQIMLDGKPNNAGQATMIVEVLRAPPGNSLGRRNTVANLASRNGAHSSTPTSNQQLPRQSSRFGGTFQSMDRVSPPNLDTSSGREMSSSDGSSHLQTIFSPQSPLGNGLSEHSRVSGKSVISQDSNDDDTGELLKDPVAYMNNDYSNPGSSLSRRSTNPQLPVSRFSNLSLNTNMTSAATSQGYTSPRPKMNMHTPTSALSPPMASVGPNMAYHTNHQFPRHNYPPVNPADQNPPCNTLYVGNLPIDTSEDELKAMFSKQRGYKRLCFRTKQNGPMCFVEFEDVSFATKALNELYGVQLHNSVKGGIRLSFSKNPLGVRAGQQGSVNPATPLSPQGPMPASGGLGPMSPGGFSTAHGPPPGLSVPPGLGMPAPMTPSLMNGGFPDRNAMNPMRGQNMSATTSPPGMGGMYPDYMMGR